MGQHVLDVRPGLPRGRRLAISAAATAAVIAGGGVVSARLLAASDAASPPVAASPLLPDITPQALARFGIRLGPPGPHATAAISDERARDVALPLGEGAQSDGWRIVGAPVLAAADYRAGAAPSRTCLCWVVELNSARPIPCDVPTAGASAVARLCDNHHLVELIDANSGARWLSVSGQGLG